MKRTLIGILTVTVLLTIASPAYATKNPCGPETTTPTTTAAPTTTTTLAPVTTTTAAPVIPVVVPEVKVEAQVVTRPEPVMTELPHTGRQSSWLAGIAIGLIGFGFSLIRLTRFKQA